MRRSLRKRRATRPDNGIVIRSYKELEAFVDAFSTGSINLLIIVGEHGLAKGTTVRRKLAGDTCWIEGSATAFGMYLQLYQHRDEVVVLDDVDGLAGDKKAVNLLKCLCQTEPTKSVSWPTAARELKKEGVPRQFMTCSRVVIISNDWRTLNRNVAAVEDRGHTLVFEPTALEVHHKTAEWFDDPEILDWFSRHLDRIDSPSMRLYYRARELKQSGLDWKMLLPLRTENPRKRIAIEVLSDESLTTAEERAAEFARRGGGCRATFFNYKRDLV